jgi:glycosyltransferase involved in cell wall biosynthesis
MEKNLRRVALATEPRGIRHSIVLLSERKDLLQFPPSIEVHRVYRRPRDPRLIYDIAQRLLRLSPTVIHARNWAAWPDTVAARLLIKPNIPLVFSYHGSDSSSVKRIERLKFQSMARLTSRMFAVSHAARELLVDAYGIDRRLLGVISNGVDTDKLSPPSEPRAARVRPKIIFGAVGRFFPIKNFPLLMRAFRRLLENNIAVELRIAGDGPHDELIRKLRSELGLVDHLLLPGYVEDMAGFFHELDVFVLSSDNEANPNALLEAMSTGLPCISTNVGGAAEVLDRGRCGKLVPANDEVAMSTAMLELAKNVDLREKLGSQARAHVLANYSQQKMIDAYEALYRDPRKAPLA